MYASYRINRIGDYIRINRVGAVGLLTGMVVLLAFPPSPLFVSELMILKQVITDRNWWLVAGLLLLMCIVIYSFGSRLIRLCYQPNQDRLHPSKAHKALSWSALSLLAAAIVLGLILGPIGENGLRRSLYLSDGDPSILFSTPLCWMLILLCVLGTCSPWLMARWEKHVEARAHH